MSSTDQVAYDQVAELTFHNVEYILHAFVKNDNLVIEAEQKSNGHRWSGEFALRYIEEMTHKTGNFKKFSVFVTMLSTALSRHSESVFIDLLTYADLEMLKTRKTGKPPSTSGAAVKNNKRYLILTYVVEFDRVHYPLPLKFEEEPNPQALKATITRLRNDLELARATTFSVGPSTSSGTGHSEQILELEHIASQYKKEIAYLTEENRQLRIQVAANADKQGGEVVAALQSQVRELRQELDRARARESAAANGTEAGAGSEEVAALEEALREEKTINRRLITKHRKDQRLLVEELEKRAESERAYRLSCRQFKSELEKLKVHTNETEAELKRLRKASDEERRRGRSRTRKSPTARSGSRGAGAGTGSDSDRGRRSASLEAMRARLASRSRSRSTDRGSTLTRSMTGIPSSSRPRSRSGSRSRPGSAGRPSSAGSSRSSRPRSAKSPAKGRFDPSAYIQEVKEKKRRIAEDKEALRRQRINGNDSDSGRGRARSRSNSRGRPSSAESDRGASSKARSRSRGSSVERLSRSVSSSSALTPSRKAGRTRTPNSRSAGSGLRGSRGSLSTAGLSSSKGAWRGNENDPSLGNSNSGDTDNSDGHFAASQEIADINERINALQYFLKAAKSANDDA
eukprot:CAMPEP_0175164268 /NCGR_PEP_ID=MMETSP0087-20121206/26306_1 /TAXON_ID=136419 /ORGANISM="Unknown Unknown, Strain D1" /LENGTH=629 /DNA_ID=CAMNT_0016453255 /DNA_START=52 /DNA_END=1941 /DNA_ORIENTATION=-